MIYANGMPLAAAHMSAYEARTDTYGRTLITCNNTHTCARARGGGGGGSGGAATTTFAQVEKVWEAF